MQLTEVEIILYVADQQRSTEFYEQLFKRKADLNVPGMTEFSLGDQLKLGLMPNRGIAKILQHHLPNPADGNGIPRCELYLMVENLEAEFKHVEQFAQVISPIEARDWGHKVCYVADPDGHVVALASAL